AKEATVSRAMGRSGVWCVTALLAGALAQLVGEQAMAYPPPVGSGPPVEQQFERPAESARQQMPPVVKTTGTAASKAQASSKVLQARARLGQGDFDVAEQLAREVSQYGLTWSTDQDSPAKVLQEVA